MAQKPFITDMGVRLGEWLITQNSDGDLSVGPVSVTNNSQRAFRVDQGFKMGDWKFYEDGDNLSVTPNGTSGSQRPFLVDAGLKISDWTITQNTDGNIFISTTTSVVSGLNSTTALTSGGSGSSSTSSGYTLANSTYDGLATSTNTWFNSGSFSNLTFANDGMTALMTFYGSSFNGVKQYNLSTAYDLTTASLHPNNNTVYEPDAFMVAGYGAMSHNSSGQDFYDAKFNNDGTRLFVADQNDIYRYDLSTAWDISTASYTGDVFRATNIAYPGNSTTGERVVHDLSYGQTGNVSFFDIHFNTDGTKLISFNHEDRMLMAWDLATAWDVTTAIDTIGDRTIVNLNNDGYRINDMDHYGVRRIEFNSDGTKMYLGSTQQTLTDGTSVEAIVEFDLSTEWDISTLSLSGNVMELNDYLPTVQYGSNTTTTNQNVMSFTLANGKFFINNSRTLTDGTNISRNFQIISLGGGVSSSSTGSSSLAYNLSLMANTNAAPDDFVLGTNSSSEGRMVWNRDGSGFYTFSEGGGHFDFFSTSTAWDISTATQDSSKILFPTNVFGPNGDTGIEDFEWNEDGTELYVFTSIGGDRMYLWKYTVSEAYNLASTLTYVTANNARGRNSNIGPVLDTQFGEEANQTLTYLFEGANHWSFADNGTKLSIQKNNQIIVFEMPTAYDPTSIDWADNALYYYDMADYGVHNTTGSFTTNTVQFSDDGTRMWAISNTNTDAYWNIWIEYTLSTPFDPSSITSHTLKAWEKNIIWGRVGGFHVTPTGKLVISGSVKRDETGTTVHSNSWTGSWTIGSFGTPTYTYAIAITNSSGQAVTTVVEGATYTLTATTDAPDGSTVWFTAQEDIEAGYTDPVTIDWLMDGTQSIARTGTVTNGVATTELTIVADETTETGYEKFRFVVSSDDDGVQWTGDGAGTTPWITIVDSSQDPAPDLTQYNWEFTIPTADTGNNVDYINVSEAGQLAEGVEYPFVITTDAPDGTQVFLWWSSSFVGTYGYDADPSNPYSDFSYQKPSYGWHTVSNGQVTGTVSPYPDSVAENGEMVRFNIKDVSGWSNYNILAKSEWFQIVDESTSYVQPQSGQQIITGAHPQHSEDAITYMNWSIDVGVGEDVSFHLTINETDNSIGRQEASFAFGQIEVGDVLTFWIIDHNGSYVSTDVTITEVGTHYNQGQNNATYRFRTGSQWAGSEFNPSEPSVNNGYYWNVSPQHIFITIN